MTWSLSVSAGLPAEWPELVAACPPSLSTRWMSLSADRLGAGYSTFVLCRAGRPVVALGGLAGTGRLASRRLDPYRILRGDAADLGLIPAGPHPWAGLAEPDVLPTALFMYPNYELFPVGPCAGDRAVLCELVERLRDWAGSAGLASLSFLFLTPTAATLIDVLRERGAAVVPLTDACELPVTWTNEAGYLDTLPVKRRKEALRELRRLAGRGVRLAEEPIAGRVEEVLALRGKLVAKYGGTATTGRDRELLAQVDELFAPEETRLFTARRAGKLLGFALFLQDGDPGAGAGWTALLTGADYDDPDSRLVYFGVMFYRPAAVAGELGVGTISYGLGSWAAKAARGCRLVPRYAAELRLTTARPRRIASTQAFREERHATPRRQQR